MINQWLLQLRAMGKSVVIVHHSSKHGTQRGTSHRSDNLDTILQLTRYGEDGFTVHFEKHRNFGAAEASPVSIAMEIDDDKAMFTRREGDDIELETRNAEIWEMHKAGTSNKAIAKHFGVTPGRISQIIKEMREEEENDEHDN